jgi:nitrite reductase (NADH) large subunit
VVLVFLKLKLCLKYKPKFVLRIENIMNAKQKLVVIGNGMAGMRTVEELLSAAPDKYEITVFGAEPYGNYNRIMLSAVLSGDKTIEDIVIHNRQWYQDHHITLHAGESKAVKFLQ